MTPGWGGVRWLHCSPGIVHEPTELELLLPAKWAVHIGACLKHESHRAMEFCQVMCFLFLFSFFFFFFFFFLFFFFFFFFFFLLCKDGKCTNFQDMSEELYNTWIFSLIIPSHLWSLMLPLLFFFCSLQLQWFVNFQCTTWTFVWS